MESAPQSTITHNAVIEFASDLVLTPRPSPRERRAHKKKACPAQKGGLKSAGPCQNHLPGATPRNGLKRVDFGRYLRSGAFEARFGKNPRNGCRRGAAAVFPCPARPEILGPPCPAMTVPIEVTATPARPSGPRERLEPILRDRAQDLVIVAAGNDASRCRRCRARAGSRPARTSGMLGRIDHRRDAGRRAELGEIAGKTVGHVHRRAGVIANGLCQRVARLRHAIASDQHRACRGIVGERRGRRAALQDIETERGVADRPGHHDAVAGLARRCDGPSCPRARARTP